MEKKPIPELPKNLEELGILVTKKFKILFQTAPVREPFSRIDETFLTLECPFCSTQFDAVTREGCFGGSTHPSNCPNCDFPNNVIDAYIKGCKEKKTEPRSA